MLENGGGFAIAGLGSQAKAKAYENPKGFCEFNRKTSYSTIR
jgi:hypothetical protein